MTASTLVWSNLFRKKLRTALMIVSILVAFAIFGVLSGFQRAFNAGEDLAAADRLVVVNKINFTQPLPIAYYSRIAALDGVRLVTHADWFGGYYQEAKTFLMVFAVDPTSYMNMYADELEIPQEIYQAFASDRTGCLVGAELARKWGWKQGDHLPISSSLYTQKDGSRSWDMTVDGIIEGKKPGIDTNFIIFQYEYFNETRSFSRDMVGWMVLRTASPSLNDQISKAIDGMFANSPYETSTDTEKAFSKAFTAQFGNIALIVTLVVGAAFVTILLIVGNTMAMAIRERTREIGVLKALGFSGPRILSMVLAESVLLALLGGLPGIGLAAVFSVVLREKVGSILHGLAVTPPVVASAVLLMVGLGVLAGIFPALNAMRLHTADALGRR